MAYILAGDTEMVLRWLVAIQGINHVFARDTRKTGDKALPGF